MMIQKPIDFRPVLPFIEEEKYDGMEILRSFGIDLD
jgi:hypothetical protein